MTTIGTIELYLSDVVREVAVLKNLDTGEEFQLAVEDTLVIELSLEGDEVRVNVEAVPAVEGG